MRAGTVRLPAQAPWLWGSHAGPGVLGGLGLTVRALVLAVTEMDEKWVLQESQGDGRGSGRGVAGDDCSGSASSRLRKVQ